MGTEHIDDIIADFEQSFKASAATKPEAGKVGQEKNGEVKGNAEVTAGISGET